MLKSSLTLATLFAALATASAQPANTNLVTIAESAFDTGNDGWTSWDPAPPFVPVTWVALGGNPGGFLRFNETQGDNETSNWFAPTNYAGNVCGAYGGILRFDMRKGLTTNPYGGGNSMVILQGRNLSLVFDSTNQPAGSWTSFVIPLTESVWRIAGTNSIPTQSDVITVLSSLRALHIRAEFRTGDDITDLDNVALLAPAENFTPKLGVQRISSVTAAISWPSSAVCFLLEESGVLDNESWSVVADVPTVQNDQNILTVDLANHTRYYRLTRVSPPAEVSVMVGNVTPFSATLWGYAGTNADFLVTLLDGSSNQVATSRMESNRTNHNAATVTLTNLAPSTFYQFSVRINGASDPAWGGSFRTAPPTNQPSRFKMAFSSCMNYTCPYQSSWNLLMAQQPAFHLLLGDTVYANTTDREQLWYHHLRQRAVPEFAGVIRNVPTYAVWDDHDYGPNNSAGNAVGKENSLRAFQELFANPAAGTDDVPGVFFSFRYGEVEFFVLDDRYHRTPNSAPNDGSKRLLGDGQFSWLDNGLRKSSAKFKVLACGSSLDSNRYDDWSLYDFCRQRLFATIRNNKIGGVIFFTGDIHECNVKVHSAVDTVGYDLYEIISSGIARTDTRRGFAALEFDTTATDPTVGIEILLGDGSIPFSSVVRLSELRPK